MDTRSPSWLQTTTCPACGAPAEVVARHVLASTDGPVEHARVQCVRRHVFNLPIAMLAANERTTRERRRVAPRPAATTRPRPT